MLDLMRDTPSIQRFRRASGGLEFPGTRPGEVARTNGSQTNAISAGVTSRGGMHEGRGAAGPDLRLSVRGEGGVSGEMQKARKSQHRNALT